jgi:hypothetical protein
MRTPLMSLVGSALLLASCSGDMMSLDGTTGSIATKVAETPGFIPGVPKGYQCPLVPNGFDPVGSIYRVDQSGTYWRVKDYSKHAELMKLGTPVRSVDISNYVLSDKQKSAAGLSYEVLKTALPGLNASGSADLKKEISVDIVLEKLKGESMDDEAADKVAALFQQEITPKPGSRYFLVREAVKAGSVSYRLKHDDLAKIGGAAQVKEIAKAKADVTVKDNDGAFEVKQEFPDRITVCVKSAELVIAPKGTATASAVSLKAPEDSAVPQIKRAGKS